MGKVCTKHILRLLWKMVENMCFLGSEHIGMRGKCPPPHPQKLLFLLIEWGENKFKCRATRSVHYRNSDLILSHQRNFTCVIILTILVCLMQKCINHPSPTSYCLSVLSYFCIGEESTSSIKLMEISG